MDGSGEGRMPRHHVAELSRFFVAHDRWLFGHACVRTRGDRELTADLGREPTPPPAGSEDPPPAQGEDTPSEKGQ